MVSRRELLLGTGATVTSGALLVNLGTETANAQASITTNGLSIADKTHVSQGSVESVKLSVESNWQYSGNHNPDRLKIVLRVGSTEAKYPIAKVEKSDSLRQSDSGKDTLTGSILETPAFDRSMFERETGETVHSVAAKLDFDLYHSDSAIASDSVTERFQVTVSGEAITADASISGSGSLEIAEG